METDSGTWRDHFTIPVLLGIAGCVLVFIGTFQKLGGISAFGYKVEFSLEDIGLHKEITVARVISLIGIAVLCIPKLPRVCFTVCGTAFYVLFAPKAITAYRHYVSADNLLHAIGLSNYIDLKDYVKLSPGFYLLIIGGLIILGCSIYFLLLLFNRPEEQ